MIPQYLSALNHPSKCIMLIMFVEFVCWVTPLNQPSAVKSFSNLDMTRFWGTYRSGHYLGMKTRSANSLVSGLMWLTQYKNQQEVSGDLLRHKCNQDNKLRYGWLKHDGVNFGKQDVFESDYAISTKFVKRNYGGHGGDWTWRVEAAGNEGVKTEQAVTFLVYFATDGDGNLYPEADGEKLTSVTGETSTLGNFKITFHNDEKATTDHFYYEDHLNSLTDIHNDAMKRIGGKYVKLGSRDVPRYIFQSLGEDKKAPPNHKKHQIVSYVVTATLPVSFEVTFESGSGDFERKAALTHAVFDAEFEKHETNFGRTFQNNFNFGSKWDAKHEKFGMAALSNMIGGMVNI